MILTVVVATYKRRDTLSVTLQKLAQQTCPATDYEVIVVDDGGDDGTAEMVEAMSATVGYSLRYLCHQNRGPGYTQNRGIKEARGELVLLIADDIHVESDALQTHIAFHREHPEKHFAALGRVLQSPDLPKTVFLNNWDPFKYYELASQTELPYWKFWACYISVKRDFMLQNGLFGEHKGAAHEDVELGYRLSKKGLRIFYLPQAMAYHYHVETLDAAVRRAYERGLHWRFIEENVPDPQIWVKYHILNFRTLKYHYQTFRNLSSSSLPPEDRSLPWLVTRQILRWIVFNGLTVPHLWIKILKTADHSAMLAGWMNPKLYRGVVSYHFIKGCHDESVARSRQTSSGGGENRSPRRAPSSR